MPGSSIIQHPQRPERAFIAKTEGSDASLSSFGSAARPTCDLSKVAYRGDTGHPAARDVPDRHGFGQLQRQTSKVQAHEPTIGAGQQVQQDHNTSGGDVIQSQVDYALVGAVWKGRGRARISKDAESPFGSLPSQRVRKFLSP